MQWTESIDKQKYSSTGTSNLFWSRVLDLTYSVTFHHKPIVATLPLTTLKLKSVHGYFWPLEWQQFFIFTTITCLLCLWLTMSWGSGGSWQWQTAKWQRVSGKHSSAGQNMHPAWKTSRCVCMCTSVTTKKGLTNMQHETALLFMTCWDN